MFVAALDLGTKHFVLVILFRHSYKIIISQMFKY